MGKIKYFNNSVLQFPAWVDAYRENTAAMNLDVIQWQKERLALARPPYFYDYCYSVSEYFQITQDC